MRKFIKRYDKTKIFNGLEKVAKSISKHATINGRLCNKYDYRTRQEYAIAYFEGETLDEEGLDAVKIGACLIADGVNPTTA